MKKASASERDDEEEEREEKRKRKMMKQPEACIFLERPKAAMHDFERGR